MYCFSIIQDKIKHPSACVVLVLLYFERFLQENINVVVSELTQETETCFSQWSLKLDDSQHKWLIILYYSSVCVYIWILPAPHFKHLCLVSIFSHRLRGRPRDQTVEWGNLAPSLISQSSVLCESAFLQPEPPMSSWWKACLRGVCQSTRMLW